MNIPVPNAMQLYIDATTLEKIDELPIRTEQIDPLCGQRPITKEELEQWIKLHRL